MSTVIWEYLSANTFVRYYIFTSLWKPNPKYKPKKRFSSKFIGTEEAQLWLFTRMVPGTLIHKNQDLLQFPAGLKLSFGFAGGRKFAISLNLSSNPQSNKH